MQRQTETILFSTENSARRVGGKQKRRVEGKQEIAKTKEEEKHSGQSIF
jgi:hypothetical protein